MGYSVITVLNNAITICEIDVLKLPVKKDNYERLLLVHHKIMELMLIHKPTTFAIEAPFFGKNVQSMLKLGRAQGVAIAAAMTFGIPVTEYSPRRIKQAITGNGSADKEQVWKMLLNIVAIPDKPKYFDATDALAVAICHHLSETGINLKRSPTTAKKKTASWEQFASANKDRITG